MIRNDITILETQAIELSAKTRQKEHEVFYIKLDHGLHEELQTLTESLHICKLKILCSGTFTHTYKL